MVWSGLFTHMIPAVRCFTCNACVSEAYFDVIPRLRQHSMRQVLEEMGIRRYCCRRMIMSSVDLTDVVSSCQHGTDAENVNCVFTANNCGERLVQCL